MWAGGTGMGESVEGDGISAFVRYSSCCSLVMER